MTDPDQWLAGRVAGAPPALRDRVLAAVEAGNAGGQGGSGVHFARRLREAGARLLAEAQHDERRAAAMTLLAADALVTLAAEWLAETDPAALATFE